MNTQPMHTPATGDLRGSVEHVPAPGDVSVGDLPNSDTATDDMRGHEPSTAMAPKMDKNGMLLGAAAVAALIGAMGIFSYATGMWNSAPPAPRVVAFNNVTQDLPAAPPQQAVAPAPVPSVAVERPPASTPPVAKRSAAPILRPAATPKRVVAPPRSALPEIAPLTTAPLEAAPISPVPPTEPSPPVQSVPEQPVPQTMPAPPPQ